jgi:hypothetical protein
MKKTLIFLPLAAVLLGGAAAQMDMAGSGETPVAAPAGVRVAAEGVVPITTAIATPGKAMPLTIKAPTGDVKDIRFAMVRGLPEGVTFTAGFRVQQSWFIAAKELAGAELVTPAQMDSGFILEFFFFRASEQPPIGSTLLNVKLSPATAGSGVRKDSRPGQTLTSARPADDLDFAPLPRKGSVVFAPAQETEMLKRGENYMRLGDVASARLVFEDLAAHGSAKGALAMGKSYDPAVLRQIFVAGNLEPSVEKARMWYLRAQDLGDTEAGMQIAALGR